MVAEGDEVHDAVYPSGHVFRRPADRKIIAVQAMNFYGLSDGQFVEEHGQPEMLGLLQQIGGARSLENRGPSQLTQHRQCTFPAMQA
jgi:hypothetical protein